MQAIERQWEAKAKRRGEEEFKRKQQEKSKKKAIVCEDCGEEGHASSESKACAYYEPAYPADAADDGGPAVVDQVDDVSTTQSSGRASMRKSQQFEVKYATAADELAQLKRQLASSKATKKKKKKKKRRKVRIDG